MKYFTILKLFTLLIGVMIAGSVWGQQVIGSYPGMNGGFEASGIIDNTVYTSAQTGKWVKNNASTTIAEEASIVRSGSKSLMITNNTTTGRRVWSPLITVASTTSTVTIQFFRRVANTTNTQENQMGVGNGTTTGEALSGSYTTPSSADTWEKSTYTRSSWTFTDIAGVIMTRQKGTGGNMYVDDFVMYNGAVDNTAPNTPGAVTVSNETTSSLDVSWVAASGGVDGGGYVVVRFASDPGTGNDPNQNGIYAVGNSVTTGGTVRYIGTSTSFTDNAGLDAGTQYWYKVYTVDKAFNYSAESVGDGTTSGGDTPLITVGSITGFGNQTVNTTSTEKSYSVSGSNLTANIVITPPVGFEISLTSGSGFVANPNYLELVHSGGIVEATTIYVVFKPTAVQAYSGNIVHASTGADSKNVAVSGTGVAPANPAAFTATAASTSQINLAATANGSSNDIVVVFNGSGTFSVPADGVAPGAVGESFAGGTIHYKGAAGSITNHTGLNPNQTVYYKAFSYDALNFYSAGATANATTLSPTITVDPATLSGFTYFQGSGPSTEKTFTISGTNLTGNVSIAATTNYEISKTSGSGYTTPLSFTPAEVATPQTVYVRLKAGLSVGTYNGELITASSSDADNKTVTCNGEVTGPVTLPYSENFFDCGTQKWIAVSVTSNRNWTCGSGYQSINAFGGDVASDDYLISPIFDLDATSNEKLTFTSWTQFSDVTHPPISLLYTTNYTGNPSTTTWLPLSATWPAQNSQAWTNSGDVNISGISGTMVRFAFRYISSGTGSGTTTSWRIDDISVTAVAIATEPSNHPTGFGATTNSSSQITVSWTDAVAGAQAPSGYLVMINTTGTFSNPADGVAQADDTDMSDDAGVKNVAHASGGSYQWQGLDPATTYYFKIFSYNGSGMAINYKVDGNEQTANTQTLSLQDLDSEVFSPVSQITSKDISSLADTQGEAEDVFIITIEDQGSGDGYPTKVTNIRIKPHTTNTADWTDAVQGVFIDDGNDFVYPTTTITDSYIDLTFGVSDLNVADGQSIEVTIWIYLKTSNIVDGAILSFMVDADNHGFTSDPSGSSFAALFSLGDFNSANFTLDVDATKLRFVQQPSNVLVDAVMSPAVTVAFADANNNTDVDYDGAGYEITLSTTGTFSGSATTEVAPVNGVATFSNVKFSAPGTGLTITATDENEWFVNNTVLSNTFNVTTGPSVLEAGDIAFVGYQSDDPDIFYFILKRDINESTVINFTDNAWTGSALATNEGTAIWTAPVGGLLSGSLIKIQGTTVSGGGTVSSNNMALAAAGDQILAYQGSSSNPTFISAISTTPFISTGSTTANTTYLPNGLSANVNAFAFTTETDNGFYAGQTSGTINFLRSAVNNVLNWTLNNSIQAFPDPWAFTFGSSSTLSQNATVFNLLIANTESLTINAGRQLTVTGTLTNNATATGMVINDGGSLIHSSAGVLGTMKRSIPGYSAKNGTGWHLLSSPVNNLTIAGSDFAPGNATPNMDDFFAWDEVNYLWLNQKLPANNITNFVNGKGYLVAYESTNTKDFEGTFNSASITFEDLSKTISKGNGWHLLGNPFQSALKWETANWSRTQIGPGAKIMNPGGTYTDITVGGANEYIPANQGFFVQALDADNAITIPAASRTHNNTPFYKSEVPSLLTLRAADGEFYVETWIQMMDEATANYDQNLDVRFIGGVVNSPQLYSKLNDNERASTNRIGDFEEELVIPLGFKSFLNREFTFTASNAASFGENVEVYLVDAQKGTRINLKTNPAYTFTAVANELTERFSIHLLKSTGVNDVNPADGLRIYAYGSTIYIAAHENAEAQISIFNITGQQVYSQRMALNGPKQLTLNVPTGWYVVKVVTGQKMVSRKVFIR